MRGNHPVGDHLDVFLAGGKGALGQLFADHPAEFLNGLDQGCDGVGTFEIVMETKAGLAEDFAKQPVEEEIEGLVLIRQGGRQPAPELFISFTGAVGDPVAFFRRNFRKRLQGETLSAFVIDISGEQLRADQVELVNRLHQGEGEIDPLGLQIPAWKRHGCQV